MSTTENGSPIVPTSAPMYEDTDAHYLRNRDVPKSVPTSEADGNLLDVSSGVASKYDVESNAGHRKQNIRTLDDKPEIEALRQCVQEYQQMLSVMNSTNSPRFSRKETPEPVANLPRIELESFSGASCAS